MNPLLITGYGNSIFVDKRKLIITNKPENKTQIFYPHQIPFDSIIIEGHSGNISFDAIRWIVKHDVIISTLNWNGNLLSVTLPKEPVSAKLRFKQYEAYSNNRRRRDVASDIINEKVRQSVNLLNELSNYYPDIKAEKLGLSITVTV